LYRFPGRTAIDKIDSSRAFPSTAFSNIFKSGPKTEKYPAKEAAWSESIYQEGPFSRRCNLIVYKFFDLW